MSDEATASGVWPVVRPDGQRLRAGDLTPGHTYDLTRGAGNYRVEPHLNRHERRKARALARAALTPEDR